MFVCLLVSYILTTSKAISGREKHLTLSQALCDGRCCVGSQLVLRGLPVLGQWPAGVRPASQVLSGVGISRKARSPLIGLAFGVRKSRVNTGSLASSATLLTSLYF